MAKKATKLAKLQIESYKDVGRSEDKKTFAVQINPESYTHAFNRKIKTTKAVEAVNANKSGGFIESGGESISFKLVFDATGIIPVDKTPAATVGDLSATVTKLWETIYKLDGTSHNTRFLILKWGALTFPCVVTDFKLNYTLFSMSGNPLRVEVDLTFDWYQTYSTAKSQSSLSSPDLTHIETVRAGDTLGLLCDKVYQDASYYLEVARVNKLSNFRKLEPGTKLYFPPIAK
ncbi:MAG: hypothetical protein ACPGXL_02620 [Chitinophagales bacterium]